MKDQIERAIDLVLEQDQNEFLEMLKAEERIGNSTIRLDDSVDVNGSANISYMELKKVQEQSEVDEEIDLLEAELLNKIKSMTVKGMSIAAIATALTLPIAVVKSVFTPSKPEQVGIEQSQEDQQVIDVIARTLFGEARFESSKGKRAVASVIWNRAKGDPLKFVQIIKAPFQFSCWNERTPFKKEGARWNDCIKIAQEMIKGEFKPITDANHYYNPNKANPRWARGQAFTTIGNHKFLKLGGFRTK